MLNIQKMTKVAKLGRFNLIEENRWAQIPKKQKIKTVIIKYRKINVIYHRFNL